MEPASRIISALGGPTAIAEAIGIHRTRVSKWQAARKRGGTNGMVPYKHIPKLLQFAESRGIVLTVADFFPGQPAAKGRSR